MTATEYGPARYRIVYADGRPGGIRTMDSVLNMLRNAQLDGGWQPGHEPVRVVPVPGTEYRGTYGGTTHGWHSHDRRHITSYASSGEPRLAALELRSPVQS